MAVGWQLGWSHLKAPLAHRWPATGAAYGLQLHPGSLTRESHVVSHDAGLSGVTVRFREGMFQGQAFQEMRSRSCQDTQGLCREPVQAHSASLCWSQQSPGPSSFKEWGWVGEKCSPPLDEGVSGKVTWRSTWHTAPLFFLSTSWTVPSSFPSSPAACPQCLCWTSHRPRLCTLQLCKAWALLFLPVYSFFLDLLMQLCDSEGRMSVWAWGRSNRGLIRFPHL